MNPWTYVWPWLGFPSEVFQALQKLAWVRRGDTPRMEYYTNRLGHAYAYGRGAGRRTYEAQPASALVEEIGGRAASTYVLGPHYFNVLARTWDGRGEPPEPHRPPEFEVCFLNRYLDQSDHLGWHADDSPEMDDTRPIAVVSLGAEREIWFRPKLPAGTERCRRCLLPVTPNGGLGRDSWCPLPGGVVCSEVNQHLGWPRKLLLQSGSLLLMPPGFQDLYEHRIPKASRKVGERISLTFRGYVAPATDTDPDPDPDPEPKETTP